MLRPFKPKDYEELKPLLDEISPFSTIKSYLGQFITVVPEWGKRLYALKTFQEAGYLVLHKPSFYAPDQLWVYNKISWSSWYKIHKIKCEPDQAPNNWLVAGWLFGMCRLLLKNPKKPEYRLIRFENNSAGDPLLAYLDLSLHFGSSYPYDLINFDNREYEEDYFFDTPLWKKKFEPFQHLSIEQFKKFSHLTAKNPYQFYHLFYQTEAEYNSPAEVRKREKLKERRRKYAEKHDY